MATELDAQYAALDKQVAAARDDVRIEYQAGLDIAKQSGLTGGAARTYARQRPEYQFAKADQQSLTEQRNAVDAQRRAATQVRTPYGTTQTEYYDPNTGESGTYISQPTPAGDKPVSQTAADVTPSQDPVPQEWSYGPSVTQSNPTQLPDIQLQEPDITPPVPQTSTADQPIPFISDETYLDPLYEPAPTSPTVANLPTSPYDINQDGVVSDSEYLYGDDELYEPVPTDDELASLQEQMDEDAEFAAIDEEFASIDAINDPAIFTAEEAAYAGSQAEFDDFGTIPFEQIGNAGYQPAPPPVPAPAPAPRDLSQFRNISEGDWRFRIRLSPFADYLYKGSNPGILAPLAATDGVLFPYTPRITVAQQAQYNEYNPTHSNFRGYWYQNSRQADIIISATFTAQDTAEANYMLAMMHFFRSASKMFYGQDMRKGTPPPLLFLDGMGEHQFNEHPAVISMFTYDLPNDVDYIATENGSTPYQPAGSSGGTGPNSTPFDSIVNMSQSAINLATSGLNFGAIGSLVNNVSNYFSQPLSLASGVPPLTGTTVKGGKTYVPTQLDINLTLLPITTREQASKYYSLDNFASGDLLRKGYW